MPKTYRSRKSWQRNFVQRSCFFCQNSDKELDYRNAAVLSRFLSQRGKIVNRARSGVCATHQRRLSREIKKARINALLPFKADSVS